MTENIKNIINKFLAELETKVRNNEVKHFIFKYVKREYIKDFTIGIIEFIKLSTEEDTIIISRENNDYFLFSQEMGKKRIDAKYINLYKLYKEIENENIKKLLDLAIEKVAEHVNRKYNKNITKNHIEIEEVLFHDPPYGLRISIRTNLLIEIAEKYKLIAPDRIYLLNYIKFEFE